MDELEFHYEEMDPAERKDRLETMRIIGAQNIYFDDPEEDDAECPEDDDLV